MNLSEIMTKFDEFLKKKSLSKKDRDNVAGLLYDFYTQTNDMGEFVHKVLQFPAEIVGIMLKNSNIGIEALNNILNNLMLDTLFTDNKNDTSFNVTCEILAVYLKNENPPDCVFKVFNKSLLMIDKEKKFADKNLNKFNKLILTNDECKNTLFKINFNNWSRPEKQRIYDFFKNLETKNMLDLSTKDMQQWLEKNNFESQDRFPIVETAVKKLKSILSEEETLRLIDIIENNFIKIKEEYAQQYEKIKEQYRDIDEKTREIIRVKNLLSKKEHEIIALQEERARHISEIDMQKKQIDKLVSELSGFSEIAHSTKEDEIYTLKNDIKNSLQPEYDKYIETRDSSISEDLFEAFKARFFRIFATLKRFGITF